MPIENYATKYKYYAPKPYKVLGHRKRNVDGGERVTGKGKFSADCILPGMLHGKTLHSPYPKAKVLSVDLSAALALPGIKWAASHFTHPEIFVLAEVRFAGEEVAAVVGVDEETCEKAIKLINVEYERSNNWVIDIYDAMKPDAPVVMTGDDSNIYNLAQPYMTEKTASTAEHPGGLWGKRVTTEFGGYGDIEQGFAECDVIVTSPDLVYSSTKNPTPNGRSLTADYRVNDNNITLTVYTKSKGHHNIKVPWSNLMHLPQSKVRHIGHFAGGMWGMAGSMDVADRGEKGGRVACWASKELVTPVRFAYSHASEHFWSWSKHHIGRIKLGFKSDGKLHAMDHDEYCESGSYGRASVRSAARAGGMLQYNRNCQHMRIRTSHVATNRLKCRDYCGIGTAPGMYNVGQTMDMAAEALGMDPIELMKMNTMQKGSFDAHWGAPMAYCDNDGHNESLDHCAAESGWATKWSGWDGIAKKTGVVKHGIGACLKTHTGGSWRGSSLMIKLFPDGSVLCLGAMGDSGQQEPTSSCAQAAELLGIPYAKVSMIRVSSDLPYVLNLGGSTGTWNTGWAVWGAACDLREKVLTYGSMLFDDAPLDDLDMDEEGVFLKSDPTDKRNFVQVFAMKNVSGAYEITGYSYMRDPNGLAIPRERGAAIWELDVDTETGEIFNRKVVSANCMGFMMNPQICDSQTSMGMAHGGCAIIMDAITDRGSGKNLTFNWIYSNIPCAMDVGLIGVGSIPFNKEGGESHWAGANAASEGQPNPHLGAVANAIYNAIGVRMPVAPFTPDKVLKALGKV